VSIERSSGLVHEFSTADISIQLLMDTTAALQEIESRVTARAFAAVMDPTKGPAVRELLERLAAVLDEGIPDGIASATLTRESLAFPS